MKNILITTPLLFAFLISKGQNAFNCFSHEVYEQQLKSDPQFKKNQEQLELETKMLVNSMSLNKAAAAPSYTIPVVFHVIHTGGAGNISSAQIMDQITILNKEFKRLQADAALTPPAFQPVAAPFDVEFRLATKDPNGNCTNGINRIYSTLSDCSFGKEDPKSLSYWPSNKYLNIWIVQAMHYGNLDCGGGGFASFPGGAPNIDGVIIRGDLISNIGTAVTNTGWGNFKGRYLMHELGHWFNLRHIWGDAVCGDDQVSDTPPAVFSNSNCPSFPYNANNNCGSGPNGEMFMNYMDYTNGPCLNMFSAGQVTRMTACINSNVSGRSNLWSNSNLIATGTNDPYVYPINCAAVPEMLPYDVITACVGDSVKFTDNSYGGKGTSRLWDFNGEPASSLTDSIVRVAFSAPGIYSPSLSKTYLGSTKTTTFTNKVHILNNSPNVNYVVPFKDSLEDVFGFDNDWVIVNRDNDGTTWTYNTSTGYSPSNCASLLNFGKKAPLIDDIITPGYDMRFVENPTMNFRLHFAGRATTNLDKLQIFISVDCGNWVSIYTKTATGGLRTVNTNFATSHIPIAESNEWRKETLNIFPFVPAGFVRFKFSFTSGGGNNIFIDDINIGGTNSVGVTKNSLFNDVSVYPNPASDKINFKFTLEDKNPITIEILDLTGRKCVTQKVEKIAEKENYASLNVESLNPGVYLITVKQNSGTIFTNKFIKLATE